MDLTLSYRALAAGQVDLIAGDATAGLIKGLDLVQLEDNRHYFPPYDAAAVARASTLLRYPQVRTALERSVGPRLGRRHAGDELRRRRRAPRRAGHRPRVPRADALSGDIACAPPVGIRPSPQEIP